MILLPCSAEIDELEPLAHLTQMKTGAPVR
jgi:hypothetical protein